MHRFFKVFLFFVSLTLLEAQEPSWSKTLNQAGNLPVEKDWTAYIPFSKQFYGSTENCLQVTDEDSHSKIELSKEEALYVLNNPTIRVSNEIDWYPYDFNEEGIPQGYVVDLIRLLAQKIGIYIEFKTASWPKLHEAFMKNRLDVLYPVRKTKERQKYARFGKPLMKTKNVFITRKGFDGIQDLDDLQDKRLALGKDWTLTKKIKEMYPEANIMEFDTVVQMYEAVAFNLADVTIDDYITASYIINKEMLANLQVGAKVNEQSFLDDSLYMMFQKENKILQKLFDKAFDALDPKELYELKAKWMHTLEIQEDNEENIRLTPEEKKYLLQKEKIDMCIDPDWMPLEANEGGEHIGMSADYMRLLEKYIGIPIEMVPTKTWLESIEFAKQRRCDIFSLAMPTPERKLYMDFTKPYLNIPLVLVTKPNEIFYADVTAITDRKIGIVEGYAYGEILQTRYPDMKLVHVKNITEGMEQVEHNKIFGFIGTLATVGFKIKEDYFGTLKIAGKFDENWELGIGVRNDEPMLKTIFEEAIRSIPSEQHHGILNKWISVDYEEKMDYTLLWQALFGILIVALLVLYRQSKLKEYNKKLKLLSITDALTGLYNRLKLDEVLEYEKKFFERYGRNLSIILIDIDDFKKINDIYGHHAGDETLQVVAKILQENIRKSDTLGRWGGEEFLIICPETDAKGAYSLAQKCRKAVELFVFDTIDKSQSASFGVAQFGKDESIDDVFKRADLSLYRAKADGKNCVRH